MTDSIRLLRIKEAAEILGISTATLRKWNKEGKLKAVRISARGDRRYRNEDIENFINQSK